MNTLQRMCADRPSRRLHLLGWLPDEPDPAGGGGGADPAKPAPPAKTFTQAEMDSQLQVARERGERKAIADMAAKFGMSPDEAAAKFKELNDADAAKLTEVQKREKAADTAIANSTAKEAAADEKMRAADIKSALAEAGATGADLVDAATLVRGTLNADADEAAITDAIAKLKERRPELFTAKATDDTKKPPAPGSDPGKPPPPGGKGGATSAERAKANLAKFGIVKETAKTT